MFVKVKNNMVLQYPYTIEQLKLDNKKTSFPKNISTELQESFGLFDVHYEGAPEFNPMTHYLVHSPNPTFINGKWTLTKSVEELTPEQVASNNANKSIQVRAKRNELLTACDWTQVLDAPVDQTAWATYRQALRDLPDQAGFPWEVEYPQTPTPV